MKRLNRKGFTLVELLAVIVILAIVVGIALYTILPTLETSRKKSFDVAVDAIRSYIQDQKEMSLLSGDLQGDAYNGDVGGATCTKPTQEGEYGSCFKTVGSTNILEVTGYDKNIDDFGWYIENGVVKINCATAKRSGDYVQSENYPECPSQNNGG